MGRKEVGIEGCRVLSLEVIYHNVFIGRLQGVRFVFNLWLPSGCLCPQNQVYRLTINERSGQFPGAVPPGAQVCGRPLGHSGQAEEPLRS